MVPPPLESRRDEVGPVRLGLSMFLLAFATALFMLSAWKLLSFFIMPSLFFDLLFIGFPLGAFVGVRLFPPSLASYRRALGLLQAVMVASVAASLLCKHFDYLRAHLFEVKLHRLLGQMGTFTFLFLPFFAAYGLSEYLGYQVGTRVFGGRMRLVYAIYLFGAAAAYLFLQAALTATGISAVLVLSVALVALASLLLARGAMERGVWGCEVALLALVVGAQPARIESAFLDLYKGSGFQSTKRYAASEGYRLESQQWGRYSLTEIMHSPRAGQFTGFYNDLMQWEYSPRYGFAERCLGMVPINIAPRGGAIAIIGAGGGRQVRWASQPWFDFARVVALEVEPAVFEA
ncbi:MAG: hypothetical protein HY721_08685, partial [Planctomycetes bacterium]|nr:hypothetical protein [Planctomycetota bacterium]